MNLKSLGIALVMSVGLFIYGYVLSTAGHDHSAHEHEQTQAVEESFAAETHRDHDHVHGDSHH